MEAFHVAAEVAFQVAAEVAYEVVGAYVAVAEVGTDWELHVLDVVVGQEEAVERIGIH